MNVRFEDENLLVGLSEEDFKARIRDFIPESEAMELLPVCNALIITKGDLPHPPNILSRLLWGTAFACLLAGFFYGLYSFIKDVIF